MLPTCTSPFSITFTMCVSQEQSFQISTPGCIYWSTIGNSSCPHLQLKSTGFNLSSIHTTTAHFLTLNVTLHFLEDSSALRIFFCYASGVSDIPTKSSASKQTSTPPRGAGGGVKQNTRKISGKTYSVISALFSEWCKVNQSMKLPTQGKPLTSRTHDNMSINSK